LVLQAVCKLLDNGITTICIGFLYAYLNVYG